MRAAAAALLAAATYAVHRFWIEPRGTHPFAAAHLNDVAASVVFAALVDAIFRVVLLRPSRAREVALATAFGALVWEGAPVVWPALRPGAVADAWDVVAYALGAGIYVLARGPRSRSDAGPEA